MDDRQGLIDEEAGRLAKNEALKRTGLVLAIALAVIFFFSTFILTILYASSPAPPQDDKWPKLNGGLLGTYPKGSVAADHVLCSEIGRNILIKGGNAVDAAISVIFCLGVVNPMSSGIGGGHFMTVYNKTTQLCNTIDAREVAPAAATESMFKGRPNASKIGWEAMGVPGELHGLRTEYEKYGGRLPWKDLVQPSIDLLDNGVPVSQGMDATLREERANILNDPALKKVFTNPKTDDIYMLGDVMKTRKSYRNLLNSLATSKDPINDFYKGWISEQLSYELKSSGAAIMTAQDLANYKSIVRDQSEVIYTDLKKQGLRICGPPPPSSSAVTQSIIKTLAGYTFDETTKEGVVDSLHKYLEASKFAYAHRSEMGDMAFVNTSLALAKNITSDAYVRGVRDRITDRAQPTAAYGGKFGFHDKGTTNIAVIDGDGNAVVVTTTINLFFGARVASESTGIIWNSQMDDFSNPDAPNFYGYPPSPANYIRPGKRPMSSISPLVIFDKNGTVQMAVGGAGGSTIISGVSTIAMRTLLLGWNLKEAMDRPRLHDQLMPNTTEYERDFPQEYVQMLSNRGHVMKVTPGVTQATAILRKNGWLTANSDWRKGAESQPAGY